MHYFDVCAIIVTYRYSYPLLTELLDALHGQVAHIFLVDNNPQPDYQQLQRLSDHYACTLMINQANLGLAKALNQGIEKALQQDFKWLILFDQDSRPAADMLDKLLSLRPLAQDPRQRIAALGPSIHDPRLRKPLPFLQFKYSGVKKIWPDATQHQLIETDMLITSGCLFNAGILRRIGFMDERLFIDNIDMEWCFRARAAHYRVLGVSDAILQHQLGDRVRHYTGLGKAVLIHGPQRQYHIMRNRLLLYRRSYVPLAWKIADLPRLCFKLVYFSLLVKPRWTNFKAMLNGLKDGLTH